MSSIAEILIFFHRVKNPVANFLSSKKFMEVKLSALISLSFLPIVVYLFCVIWVLLLFSNKCLSF